MNEETSGGPITLGKEKETLRTFTGMGPKMLTVQQEVMKDCPASNANSAQGQKHMANGS